MKPVIEKILKNSWMECITRWFLGGVFLYACIDKMTNPAAFAKIIYGYGLLPDILINGVAIVMPFIEAYTGLFLISGIYPRTSAMLANTLLGIFILAIGINLARGHQFDCGCFSVSREGHTSSNIELLLRDSIYFIFGLIPILFRGRRRFVLKDR